MGPFSYLQIQDALDSKLKDSQLITASDGIKLAYYDFAAKQTASVLIFYHGGGIWSHGLYQTMAEQLSEKGISVYLFDLRGHGNSEGSRGDTPKVAQVWQDIDTAISFVKHKHPAAKVFLGGHSSGAGLLLNYSDAKKESVIDGYVFVAPYLGIKSGTIREHLDSEKRFIKKVKSWAFMFNILSGGLLFSHTPAIFFNYSDKAKERDGHILDYYTTAMSLACCPYEIKPIFKKLDRPFLLMIGRNDEQFIPEQVVAFKELASQVYQNSSAQIIPNATHLSIVLDSVNLISEFIKK